MKQLTSHLREITLNLKCHDTGTDLIVTKFLLSVCKTRITEVKVEEAGPMTIDNMVAEDSNNFIG